MKLTLNVLFVAMLPLWGNANQIMLVQSCQCREGGNATSLSDGQFVDTLRIQGDPGQIWTLFQADNAFHGDSPQPPALPIPLQAGQLIPETAPGEYSLPVVHLDGLGYSVVATNGQDFLPISNSCSYPHPQVVQLGEVYCENDGPMALEADLAGMEGEGQFDIFNAGNGQLLVADAAFLDPLQLGVGQFVVRYSFDQTPDQAPCLNCYPGCPIALEQYVAIADDFTALSCNNLIQVSLDASCQAWITPDLILEGSYPAYDGFEVEIFNGISAIGNPIDGTWAGQELTVKVTQICSGSSCWGTLVAEDKWAPQIGCPTGITYPACSQTPEDIPAPAVWDNCDTNLEAFLISQSSTQPGCEGEAGLWRQVVRTWGAVDAQGNEAAPCLQILEWIRPDLEEVQFPPVLVSLETGADCQPANTEPDNTGYPAVNGNPLVPQEGPFCNLWTVYEDELTDACEGSFKILRTWTVLDECLPTSPGLNPRKAIQFIEVSDKTPPVLSCPPAITLSANEEGCIANVILPPVSASDNCSDITFETLWPSGWLPTNGGPADNLPVGVHTLEYRATDACGNLSSCEVTLTITDLVAPVAICDEFTVVALDVDGYAELPASDLDDGSYDLCTDVEFAVRRMDSIDPFQEFATFSCADVDAGPVMVVLQVSDFFGQVNTCMVQVIVQDKLGPTLVCPADYEIGCSEQQWDTPFQGAPLVIEACDFELDTLISPESLGVCGVGTITRTFSATDASGNTGQCVQTITIFQDSPLEESDIIWPLDYEAPECTDSSVLYPDQLPQGFQRPILPEGVCGLIATNYEDAYFEIAPPACFKIVRTWRVIDWCIFDPNTNPVTGLYEYEQVIKVVDNTPPVIACNFSPFVKIVAPQCFTDVNLLMPTVTDCSPEVEVIAESDLGSGFGPFLQVPLGSYNVTYTAYDQCGNFDVCSYVLQVVDAKEPTPYCNGELVVELNPMTNSVPVNVNLFDAGSFDNCTEQEDLIISYSPFDPADTVRVFSCPNQGVNIIKVWVIDEAGNSDFCNVTLIVQNNMGACQGAPLTAGGVVVTEGNIGLHEAEVQVNGLPDLTEWTEPDGAYLLDELQVGGDYTISPFLDEDPRNGVTTFDLTLIARHVLQIQPLSSPYKIIAADVNRSGSVTTLDMVELQKLILYLLPGFTNNTSWRFVDAGYVFPDLLNPFDPGFPEWVSFNDIPASVTGVDFIAVKIGDVNGSAATGIGPEADEREGQPPVWLEVEESGTQVLVRVSDPEALVALQGTLGYDNQVLKWSGVWAPAEDGLMVAEPTPGKLTFSWFWPGEPVWQPQFTLVFQKIRNAHAEFALADNWLPGIAYTPNGQARPLALLGRREEARGRLMAIEPNPFSRETLIRYFIPEGQAARLEVRDLTGRLLAESREEQPGVREFLLQGEWFPEEGLYYLLIRIGDYQRVEKLVFLR